MEDSIKRKRSENIMSNVTSDYVKIFYPSRDPEKLLCPR